MKVAFVYPEVYDVARFGEKRKEFPPFGVLYLATVVSAQNGWGVRIFSVGPKSEMLNLSDFDVVAFSIPSSVTYHIIKGVRLTSVYKEDALIIAGGVHANIYPEHTLRDLNVHAIGVGHGDETIVELIREKDRWQFSNVKGVCYLTNNKAVYTEQRALKSNLDYLPAVPARHLLPDQDFVVTNRLSNTKLRMTHVMTSRGCPFSCNFCASQQRKMQYRSGWHLRQELEQLIDVYNIQGFASVEDNFLVNKTKVRDICRAISDLGLKWSTLSRVDGVDYGTLEEMHAAGCIEIKLGVESGSNTILEAMGKGVSVNQIRNAIQMVHAVGIKAKVFIIHGYPSENMETTDETIKLLGDHVDMIAGVSLFRFVPLPGSRVYADAGKNRLTVMRDDWSKLHIHHNPFHWWGNDEDFKIVEQSYRKLEQFIQNIWR